MKLLLVCLFIVFISRPSCGAIRDYVDSFEFGQNYGSVSFSKSGSFGRYEKVKREYVSIPPCTKLMYVRVDVNNRSGPPSVTFDWKSQTVVLQYNSSQNSMSQYTIIAKTVPTYCRGTPKGPITYYGIEKSEDLSN